MSLRTLCASCDYLRSRPEISVVCESKASLFLFSPQCRQQKPPTSATPTTACEETPPGRPGTFKGRHSKVLRTIWRIRANWRIHAAFMSAGRREKRKFHSWKIHEFARKAGEGEPERCNKKNWLRQSKRWPKNVILGTKMLLLFSLCV